MDITGIDIAAIVTGFGSLGGCIAAGVKAIKSGNEALAAKADAAAIIEARKETAEQRNAEVEKLNTEIEVLKNEVSNHDRRLKEGLERFDNLESELKETNGLLREILGAIKITFNLTIDGNGTL